MKIKVHNLTVEFSKRKYYPVIKSSIIPHRDYLHENFIGTDNQILLFLKNDLDLGFNTKS